jgi:hypothetical protein
MGEYQIPPSKKLAAAAAITAQILTSITVSLA